MGIILGKVDRHELGEALSREVHYFADRSRDGIMIWVRKNFFEFYVQLNK